MNKKKLTTSLMWCLGVAIAMAPAASKAGFDIRLYGSAGLGGTAIGGTAVQALLDDSQFPDSPELTESVTAQAGEIGINGLIELTTGFAEFPQPFSTGDTGLNDYGGAATGILYAPATGTYKFYVRSDDASRLSLSTDHTRGNMAVIAEQTGCCNAFSENRPLVSEEIQLEAGQGYYLEMLWKEGGGGDWMQIGWSLNGSAPSVIPLAYIQRDVSSYALGINGINEVTDLITTPNSFTFLDVFTDERQSVDLIVEFDFNGEATVQWQVNTGSGGWTDIEGAVSPILTVAGDMANDGNQYRASVNGTFSDAYTVTVQPDTDVPTVGFIDHRGNPNALVVPFSEPVNLAQALNASNYSVNGGALPAGAQLLSEHPQLPGDGSAIIILADFGFERGDNITVEVSGIDDLAATPNTIEDTTRNILFEGGIPVIYDFNDGLNDQELAIYGSAEVRDSGGVGDSGYLKITDGVGSQLGAALLVERRDINQVTFEFQARIGDTSGRPADGFSFNVADDMPTGTYPQSEEGYAGGEANAPAGLVVAFDNWSSGGSDRGVGIEIKYQNESRAFVATPEVTAGGAPTTNAAGIPSIHRGQDWFPVSVDLSIDGFATVVYDNVTIMDRVNVGWEGVTNAQAGFGGRTGGAWQSHWFDDVSINYLGPDVGDINIVSQPVGASVNEHERVSLSVEVGGYPNGGGFQWYHMPAGGEATAIAGATGRSYSFTAAPSRAGSYYVVASNWFSEAQSDSVTVEVTPDTTPVDFTGISGHPLQNQVTLQFSDPINFDAISSADAYSITGPNGALAVEAVTSVNDRTVALTTAMQEGATRYSVTVTGVADRAETPNVINVETTFNSFKLQPGGLTALFYNGGGNLNFYPEGDRGLARYPAGARPYSLGTNLDAVRARLSSTTPYFESPASGNINVTPPGDVSNNYNQVIFGFIRPAQSGSYRFGLGVDDNAALYLSTDDDPANSSLIASEPEWNGIRVYETKPSNQSEVIDLEAGQDYYVELLTGEGGGGDNAAVAWTFASAGEEPATVTNGSLPIPGHLLWSYQPVADGAVVLSASPANGATGVWISDTGINFVLRDGLDEVVDADSVVLKINGQEVEATVSKSNDDTSVSFAGGANYGLNSTVSVSVSYNTADGASNTLNWSFQTENIPSLMYAAPLSGAGDAGMLVTVRQGLDSAGATRPNTINDAEAQLAGNWGDVTFEADDILVDYINHNQDGDGAAAGRFANDLGMIEAELMDANSTDSITWEVITYIEFPEAGPVTMAVNSDDGFLVTHGMNPAISEDDMRLGLFNGGRGASDTIFRFLVPEPGIYPFRLLWFEGGGGANVEWWTMDDAGVRHLINDPNDDAAFNAYTTASPVSEVAQPVDAAITGVSSEGGNITIQFTGKLQSAPSINGPWTDVTGGSPYSEAIANGAKFFRAVQ